MKSDPLPFCVCIKPTRAFVDGLPVANFCGSCGKPIPPQGEKHCPKCHPAFSHNGCVLNPPCECHAPQGEKCAYDICGYICGLEKGHEGSHKESSVKQYTNEDIQKRQDVVSSVKEEVKLYGHKLDCGIFKNRGECSCVKEERRDLCFGQPCKHDGTQKCAVLPKETPGSVKEEVLEVNPHKITEHTSYADLAKETPVEGWVDKFESQFLDIDGNWDADMNEPLAVVRFIRFHLAEERQRGREEERMSIGRDLMGLAIDISKTDSTHDHFAVNIPYNDILMTLWPEAKYPREGAEGK